MSELHGKNTFYNKFKVGQVNECVDWEGKKHYRGEKLLVMLGENNIVDIEQVYDPDHFIFQFRKPITREEYESYRKAGVPIPQNRLGSSIMCSCGAQGVVCIDPKAPKEMFDKAICKSLMEFGIHQTSFIRDGNTIRLPKQIEQDKLMLDSDLEKLYGSAKDNLIKRLDEDNSRK